jgi:hypothetical protein
MSGGAYDGTLLAEQANASFQMLQQYLGSDMPEWDGGYETAQAVMAAAPNPRVFIDIVGHLQNSPLCQGAPPFDKECVAVALAWAFGADPRLMEPRMKIGTDVELLRAGFVEKYKPWKIRRKWWEKAIGASPAKPRGISVVVEYIACAVGCGALALVVAALMPAR